MSPEPSDRRAPLHSEPAAQSPPLTGDFAPLAGDFAVRGAESSAKGMWTDVFLAVAAFVLAVVGQFYFRRLEYVLDGVIFFAAAIVVFAVLVRGGEAAPNPGGSSGSWLGRLLGTVRANPVRSALAVLGVVLAYATIRVILAKAGPEPYWDVFCLWLISSFCFAAALVRFPRPGRVWSGLRAGLRRHWPEILAVASLTAIAAALRLVQLGETPNIISGDEGRIGTLAQSVLRGEFNNMMSTVFGNSTLGIYVVAGVIKLLGSNAFALRLTAAIAGTLTIPALYVFARRFFGVRVALIAAALLTVSHIHVHFSRLIVAGSIQDALFAVVAFYLFLSGLENRSRTRLVLAGLTVALHLYVYMGARLVILLLPVYVLALLITNPRLVRDNLGNLIACAAVFAVAAAPMALWAIQHPAEFNARANQIGVIQSGWLANEAVILGQSQARLLVTLFGQAFLTVNHYPAVAFYNSSLPILDFASGAVFMLGLAYSLLCVTDRRHLLLQGWFWSAIVVGGALVVLPAISAYRILIMLPAVCVFVALGWDRLIDLGTRALAHRKAVMVGLTMAFVAVFSVLNVRAYWTDYAPSCRYEDWNTRFASYMGQALGEAGSDYKAYLLGYPRIWYGIHPSVDFLSGGNPITDVKTPLTGPVDLASSQAGDSAPQAGDFAPLAGDFAPLAGDFADGGLRASPSGKAIFFFTPDREQELYWVQQSLPGGQVRRIDDCGSLMLTIYQVGG